MLLKGEAFHRSCCTGTINLHKVLISSRLSSFPQLEGEDLATRGRCMDKKAVPRLLAPAGLEVAHCQYRLWKYLVSSPVKEEVYSWMSLQVFLLKFLGTQVCENCTPAALSHCMDQLLVKDHCDCSLALHFAVFEFLT